MLTNFVKCRFWCPISTFLHLRGRNVGSILTSRAVITVVQRVCHYGNPYSQASSANTTEPSTCAGDAALCTLLNHYTPLRTLHSANQFLLQHPRVSTEFARRSFSYLAPKIWNNIPVDMTLLYPTNLQTSSPSVPI